MRSITVGGEYHGLNVAGSDIRVERQGGRYLFKVKEGMFPLVADAKQNSKVRLARDYDWGTTFSQQASLGYVLELIDWDGDPDEAADRADLNQANTYLVTDLQYVGLENSGGELVVFSADTIPADLAIALVDLGVVVDGNSISLGGPNP